ncbi:MAG TPA: flagellar biosynthesis regulator FlaF [Alphaproteobacteria bacterium]
MGYSAYKFTNQQAKDTRDTEYRLLAQVTAALLVAKEKNSSSELRERIDAVLWNRDVWGALKADLSSEGNSLPKELRASLISIAIWVEKESLRVVDGKGDIDALIEVNRNIMEGLKPKDDVVTEEVVEEKTPATAENSGFVTAV